MRRRSDELHMGNYDTDKPKSGYMPIYDSVFSDLIDNEINLLELGVHKGGSLDLWMDYFPKATVSGIDLLIPRRKNNGRAKLFQGHQSDVAFLTKVANEVAPQGFDIIIDDASHIGYLTSISFWHLFENHLKPGGIYVIEDWGTGYMPSWTDGAAATPPRIEGNRMLSHDHGMVGFVKQLIDELAIKKSRFSKMTIMHSIAFIHKRI